MFHSHRHLLEILRETYHFTVFRNISVKLNEYRVLDPPYNSGTVELLHKNPVVCFLNFILFYFDNSNMTIVRHRNWNPVVLQELLTCLSEKKSSHDWKSVLTFLTNVNNQNTSIQQSVHISNASNHIWN